MESTREKNITLDEMADYLHMTKDELVDRLRKDGFMSGNTQSRYARHLKIFEVEQCGARFSGGLVHRTGFRILVRPQGRKFLMRQYGPEVVAWQG